MKDSHQRHVARGKSGSLPALGPSRSGRDGGGGGMGGGGGSALTSNHPNSTAVLSGASTGRQATGRIIRSPYVMKLVSYDRAGARRLGAWVAGGVIDLPDAVGHPAFPTTLEALVAHSGGTTLDAAREALSDQENARTYAVPRARLLVPLLPSSLRGFQAFRGRDRQVAAGGGATTDAWQDAPVYFKGNHRSVLGPEEDLVWPAFTR